MSHQNNCVICKEPLPVLLPNQSICINCLTNGTRPLRWALRMGWRRI